jgi:dipeptidase D
MSQEAIKGLKPAGLWERFYEISQVPRPSKKEEKILEYLKELCTKLNLEYKQDKTGNMLISIPAVEGYENAPVVVLQAHVDMVCEKNNTSNHDFENDPIKLVRTNGWLKADGTTLGSDNGIGVAAALAVATDKEIIHGPVEILLTVDEETGLTGANNLEPGFVTGKMLFNLDSEEDGAFYVGCAGGIDTVGKFKIETESIPSETESFKLSVTGLKGGHSGLDIHTGRGNAIKLLARSLKLLSNFNTSVSSIEGGNLRNAIPREASAVIHFNEKDKNEVERIIRAFEADAQNEFKTSEGNVTITLTKNDSEVDNYFKKDFFNRLVNTLLALPAGVISMSQDIPDLVETSTNLATIKIDNGYLKVGTSQRSSVESAKKYIAESVSAVFNLSGAEVERGDGYPGWKPDLNSDILKISKESFKELFGTEPMIKAIHAGLECGILGGKYPGLEMISFGPTIEGAHSPDEKIKIETVERFYSLLKAVLKKAAELK